MTTEGPFFDIICFSTIYYGFLKQRPQQIMSRLSKKGARVLYVEPPFGLTREVLKQLPYYFRIWKKDGVYVYRLPLIVWKGILLNKSLSKVMLRTLIRMLGMGKGRPLLSWFYDVQFSFLAGKMDESLSVYDCVDELSGFSYVTRRHIEYEKDLLRKVDILFVTSLPLFNRKREMFSKQSIYIIRNAADFDHFSQLVARQVSVPKEMQKIEKPIVGFIGTIGDWIDFQLIRQIAETFNVIMIGPVHRPVKSQILQIRNLPNVHLLGRIEYDKLPTYLRAMDVCIVPFKLNKLTESANPVKIYEYLAAGKPVVSTNLPETRHFGDLIKTATDGDEFLDAIRKGLNKRSNHKKALKRRKFAKKNSWESRCNNVLSTIDSFLRKQRNDNSRALF